MRQPRSCRYADNSVFKIEHEPAGLGDLDTAEPGPRAPPHSGLAALITEDRTGPFQLRAGMPGLKRGATPLADGGAAVTAEKFKPRAAGGRDDWTVCNLSIPTVRLY